MFLDSENLPSKYKYMYELICSNTDSSYIISKFQRISASFNAYTCYMSMQYQSEFGLFCILWLEFVCALHSQPVTSHIVTLHQIKYQFLVWDYCTKCIETCLWISSLSLFIIGNIHSPWEIKNSHHQNPKLLFLKWRFSKWLWCKQGLCKVGLFHLRHIYTILPAIL